VTPSTAQPREKSKNIVKKGVSETRSSSPGGGKDSEFAGEFAQMNHSLIAREEATRSSLGRTLKNRF